MMRLMVALLLAVCLGFSIGLSYAWVIAPARVANATPDALRSDFKDHHRVAIASAYAATGNLERARARLALLGDADSAEALTAQAQQSLAAGKAPQIAEDLAALAADVRTGVSSVPRGSLSAIAADTGSSMPTPGSPHSTVASPVSLTPTSAADLAPPATSHQTPIAASSQTAVPSPRAPFVLLSQDPVCNANLTPGLVQITVLDQNRQPMPGVEVTIIWDTGEEHVFTGLKPEISAGYADFVMQAGMAYSLHVARSGAPVSDLTPPTCPGSGNQSYLGSLKLTFRQP